MPSRSAAGQIIRSALRRRIGRARGTALAIVAVAAVVSIGGAADAARSRNGQTADRRPAPRPAAVRAVANGTASTSPLQIMVSLNEQRVTVYQDGVAITSSAISSGQPGYGTPTGIYSILQKSRYHESNIYSGAAMPYMQRITWSGIALHEGHLPGYPASHGCIRLPPAFASNLFGLTKVGARVVVSRERLTPQPIEHDLLADLSQRPLAAFAERAPVPAPAQTSMTLSEGNLLVSAASASAPPAHAEEMATTRAKPTTPLQDLQADGQVAILISRQTSKIYIRRNFQPVFDGEVIIHDSEQPLGTHLFTATGSTAYGQRLTWNVVSFAGETPHATATVGRPRKGGAKQSITMDSGSVSLRLAAATAQEALSRIEFDEDVLEEIAEVAGPGLSLIITDRGPGAETGKGTEFVIQSR